MYRRFRYLDLLVVIVAECYTAIMCLFQAVRKVEPQEGLPLQYQESQAIFRV